MVVVGAPDNHGLAFPRGEGDGKLQGKGWNGVAGWCLCVVSASGFVLCYFVASNL